MKAISIPNEVMSADVIYCSHSGGKDSQAMLAALIRHGLKSKIVLIHSDLNMMEWEPMHQWIESIGHGLKCHVISSRYNFFSLAEKYNHIPDSRKQFCTDHLKTKPICDWIHWHMTKHGYTSAINATGMRAQESKRRASYQAFQLSEEMHMPRRHPGHVVSDWRPILDFTEYDVFMEIKEAGQEPHHIYSLGFSRLSCVFCVNGRIDEHQKAAEMRPELAARVAQLERRIGRAYRLKQVNKVRLPKFFDTYIMALLPKEVTA